MTKIDDLLKLASLIEDQDDSISNFPFTGKVFIRTVTFYYTGEVVSVTDKFVVLKDAAWIADTGRFATALNSGVLNEVEPFPENVAISLGSIIDASPWKWDLPREQK